MAEKANFHSIDLLRGIAAISVLIFHFKNFAGGGGDLYRSPAVFDRVALLGLLQPIREYGSVAVMFFWAISGFVFMNVYAGMRPGGRQFWVNRIARLYPLHLLTLLVIAAIQGLALAILGHWLIYPANDLSHFVPHLVFASAWPKDAPHSFNGPVWSVSVEVLIYAAFFLYVRHFRINLATGAAGLFGFMVAIKLFPDWQVPVCGAFFFGGVIAYAVYHLWPAQRHGLLFGLALAGLGLCCLFALTVGPRLPLTLSLLPIFMSLLLLGVTSEEIALRPAYRRMQVIGDLTYSSYMWHSSVQMLFLFGAGLGWWALDAAFTDAFFLGYLALVCGLAWLSFHFIERPAQRWVRAYALGRTRDKALIAAP